jgi:hypothetical protein
MIYVTAEASLKKLLLQAVPAIYTQKLRDPLLGYANITTLSILEHLDNTYGKIDEDDLDRNLIEMNKPWQVSSPIESLFQQLYTCREFAASTDPISEATTVRSGLQNLENTKAFTEAIREWRAKPKDDRTLANFEAHFIKADAERKRTATTRSAGYHQTAAAAIGGAKQGTTSLPDSNVYYCWSHGLGYNSEHTSATCKRQAPGHRQDSTLFQMFGGCNTIQRRRGETQVYVRPLRTTTSAPASVPH